MNDEVLGSIQLNEEGAYEGIVTYIGRNVTFMIEPDGVPVENTLALARRVIYNIGDYETRARIKVCEEFLVLYNDTWRDEKDPELNADQFKRKLKLDHFWFLSDNYIDVYYDDDDLFAGHSLIAQSRDGNVFAYAEMFG